MGDMMRLYCIGCGIDRNEFLGVGMSLEGQELCACYRCRRFVRKKIKWTPTTSDTDPLTTIPEISDLKCPYCRKPVVPFESGDRCPVCESVAELQPIGIWD